DINILDLTDASVQSGYQDMVQNFVDEYNIDGVSMMVAQDDVDASEILPGGIKTYGFLTSEDAAAGGFDYMATESMRTELAEAFATIDREIPEIPDDETCCSWTTGSVNASLPMQLPRTCSRAHASNRS